MGGRSDKLISCLSIILVVNGCVSGMMIQETESGEDFRCQGWAEAGFCVTYKNRMEQLCPAACSQSTPGFIDSSTTSTPSPTTTSSINSELQMAYRDCDDLSKWCQTWTAEEECIRSPSIMLKYCQSECEEAERRSRITNSNNHRQKQECNDRRENCILYKTRGLCSNDHFVNELMFSCAKTCGFCQNVDDVQREYRENSEAVRPAAILIEEAPEGNWIGK